MLWQHQDFSLVHSHLCNILHLITFSYKLFTPFLRNKSKWEKYDRSNMWGRVAKLASIWQVTAIERTILLRWKTDKWQMAWVRNHGRQGTIWRQSQGTSSTSLRTFICNKRPNMNCENLLNCALWSLNVMKSQIHKNVQRCTKNSYHERHLQVYVRYSYHAVNLA